MLEHLERFLGKIWDMFEKDNKARLQSQPTSWPTWDLDPKFFQAMSRWTLDHPESSLEKVLEKVCGAIEKSDGIMESIPDSPFPARSLITALTYLLRLGISSLSLNELLKNDGRWSGLGNGLSIAKEIEDFKARINSARALFIDLSLVEISTGLDTILLEIDKIRQLQKDQLQSIYDKLDAQDQARSRKKYLDHLLRTVANPTYDDQGKQPCDEGTRAEILAEIMGWINDRSSQSQGFLWLTGDPGAGKSAITASIARDCKDKGILWAQFFINRNNAETTNPRLFFPTIARQFIDHSSHPGVEIAIVEALKNRPSLMDAISNAQASHLFVNVMKIACESDRDKSVVVVIDALDETDRSKLADTANILSQIFSSLSGQDSHNAKVLISSRTDDDIRKPFAKMMDIRHVKHIHLDTSEPSSIRDVSTYITARISRIVESYDLNWHQWPGEARMQAMCIRASGLFIWAVTVMKFFQDQIDKSGKECLDDLLNTFSIKGMGDINVLYGTILQFAFKECDDAWRFETFRRVVGCVATLKEPLAISAIQGLLDLRRDPSSPPVDLIHFFRRLRTVLVAGAEAIDGETVPRLHKSFFEFITSQRAKQNFRVNLRSSNGELALRTIHRLVEYYPGPGEPSNMPQSSELRYAVQSWGLHLGQADEMPSGVCVIGDTLCPGQGQLESLLYSLPMMKCNPFGIAISAEGKIAITHYKNTLDRWIREPRRFSMISAHDGPCSAMAFSLDRQTVALSDTKNIIHIWSVETHRPIYGLPCEGHIDKVRSIAFSPDGKSVVSGGDDGVIHVWCSRTGKLLCRSSVEDSGKIYGVAVSPDGRRIATCGPDGKIQLFQMSESACRLTGPPFAANSGALNSITFSPDGSILMGAGKGLFHLWDSNSGKLLRHHPSLPQDSSTAKHFQPLFSPSGDILSSDERSIYLGQLVHLEDALMGVTKKHSPSAGDDPETNYSICAAVSPNGRFILVAGHGTIQLWDLKSSTFIFTAPGQNNLGFIRAVAFSKNGKEILSVDRDGIFSQWDVPAVASCHYSFLSACISSNAILTSSFDDHLIRFRDVDTFHPTPMDLIGNANASEDYVFITVSPDERRIAAISTANIINLWDAGTRRLVCAPMKHYFEGFNSSLSLFFSSDSSQLTLACINGKFISWNASNGSPAVNSIVSDRMISLNLEEEFFDLKNGWRKTHLANHSGSQRTTPNVNEPVLGGSERSIDHMQWRPYDMPGGGLWAYMDGRLIRSNGGNSVTILDVRPLL
ncbi:hypothetical protein HWV62_769 [Athelia sp. TMB]|nr:hypothetical protein HWV62_769 [Athelia sp. TMB]